MSKRSERKELLFTFILSSSKFVHNYPSCKLDGAPCMKFNFIVSTEVKP